jgi:hypothetical protein
MDFGHLSGPGLLVIGLVVVLIMLVLFLDKLLP